MNKLTLLTTIAFILFVFTGATHAYEVGDVVKYPTLFDFIIMAWDNGGWMERSAALLPFVHHIASAYVAWTDTPDDDILYGKVYKFIEKLAGMTEKSKQTAGNVLVR